MARPILFVRDSPGRTCPLESIRRNLVLVRPHARLM
jgi:hypothetical protein